jgi:hypothetical protein
VRRRLASVVCAAGFLATLGCHYYGDIIRTRGSINDAASIDFLTTGMGSGYLVGPGEPTGKATMRNIRIFREWSNGMAGSGGRKLQP